MSDDKNLTEQLPIDPAQPETKSNLLLVVALVAFLGLASWFVMGVSEDPPETVEEATEIIP